MKKRMVGEREVKKYQQCCARDQIQAIFNARICYLCDGDIT